MLKKSVLVAALSVAFAGVSQGAAIINFDSNVSTNPFSQAYINGQTSFSGSVTDGAMTATLTFADPKTGVVVTTPAAPTGGAASTFGAEAGGFGVNNAALGRFDIGEQFTITSTAQLSINNFRFHEHSGDETLTFQFTQNGLAQTLVLGTAVFTGASPSNATVLFPGVIADAGTPIVITNSSPSTANAAGRLRFRGMEVSVVPEPTALAALGLGGLALLRRRR